ARRIAAPLGHGAGDGETPYLLQSRLRDLMWEHVGLLRAGAQLERAVAEIEEIGRRAERVTVPGGAAYNLAWQDCLNLQSQAAAAWLIARSALERAESRGSHFRRDFPEPSRDLYNVFVEFGDASAPRVWTEPVRLTRLAPAAAPPTPTVEAGD